MYRKQIKYEKGDKIGNLIFIEETEKIVSNSGKSRRAAMFLCFCGNKFIKGIGEIKTGNTTSCGCKLNRNYKPEYKGSTYTPEYRVWNNLKNRCTNRNAINYHRYGGRGIIFCEKWKTFEGFFEDMGKRPSDKHSLDRIDNNLGYCKENCRWATKKEQVRNRETNIYILYNGENKVLIDIAREVGLDQQLIKRRLNKGWNIEEAIKKDLKYKR